MTPVTSTLSAMVAWCVVAVAAAVVARLLTWAVGRSLGHDSRSGRLHRGIEVVFVAAAVFLWWWEIHGAETRAWSLDAAGLAPTAQVSRYAAHLVLLALLAAATWIDLEYRVIPDEITVPGVLAGLLWTSVDPRVLLPIVREVPRSFAAPAAVGDVLGLFGPLHGVPPFPWLGERPAATGLAAAVLVYVAWWLGCTAPRGPEPPISGPAWRRSLRDPRLALLAAGIAGIVTAWLVGDDHWLGLLSSLAGLAVAAGIVWLTRTGASWALGREAMGLGDVTLMAMVGAWLGWQPCVLVCFVAVFIGLAHGLVQVVLRSQTELPFGPSLCLAAALVVVLWRPLWGRTEAMFSQPLELAIVAGMVIGLTALSLSVLRWLRENAV